MKLLRVTPHFTPFQFRSNQKSGQSLSISRNNLLFNKIIIINFRHLCYHYLYKNK